MQQADYDLVVRPLRLPTGIFLFGIQATLPDPCDIDFEDTAGRRVQLLPGHVVWPEKVDTSIRRCGVTPAMEAKVSDHVWSLEDISKLAD